MREIKFRGKVSGKFDELEAEGWIDENGWVVGNSIQNGDYPMIVGDLVDIDDEYIAHEWWVSVIPETISQYTGLKDKNGVEVYEGDYVNVTGEGAHLFSSEVKWFSDRGYPSFDIEPPNGFYYDSVLSYISNVSEYEIEVIGNKFDNPELLESK